MQNPELSRNQAKALQALLTCSTIAEAAECCGLTERTLYNYLADDTFKAELRRRQDEILSSTTAALTGLSQEAVKALADALAVLSDQTGADVGDFIQVDDRGGWKLDLAGAEEAGLLHLVKKLWTDKEDRDRLELYDSQSAAYRLGRLALDVLKARREAVELDQLAERISALERILGEAGQ